MAAQAALIAYGPMRKSAIALVGKNPSIDIEMKAYLPTAPDNFRKALRFDEGWWNGHGGELAARFQTWREQPVVTDAKTAAPDGKPSGADAKSKATDAKPSTAEEKSEPGDAKAATADEKPRPAEAKPPTPEAQTGSVRGAAPKPPNTPPNRRQ
jgi:hypothetical protein